MNTNEPTTPSDAPTPETRRRWAADWLLPRLQQHTPRLFLITAEDADEICRKCDDKERKYQYWQDKALETLGERDEARAELAKLKTPSTPTDGSAVEWLEQQVQRTSSALDGSWEKQWVLKSHALELARRADETEAQLAAAQAEARELREALDKLIPIADACYLSAFDYAPLKPLKEGAVTRCLDAARAALAKKEGER